MPVFENPATEVSPPAMAAPPDLVAVAAPRARAKNTPIAAIAAGAGILLGGGLLAAFLWNRGPGPTTEPGANADVPAATAPATADTPAATPAPAPAAPPPAAPAAASSGDSEIVAERQVWMRVTVDGARVVEREVPAGTRIPLKAEKTIVIRTGNAGAVRLSIRGQAGALLGREGEVVTRSFTVPPPSAPGVR